MTVEETEPKKREPLKNQGFFLIVCIGLFIGLILKLFVFEILTVSGRSMQPAINDGDRIFISKLSYGLVKPYGDKLLVQWKTPQRGDIIIYLYNDKIVVKRCVAVAGDLLEYSADNVYNLKTGGKQIKLTEHQYENLKNSGSVPEGFVLAIGDNYDESVDSRTYGFVSVRNILGKVLCK